MAKHVLFLVHGTARHDDGSSTAANGPGEVLSSVAEAYADFSPRRPLEDSVELVEIRYDDIFASVIERWAALGQALRGTLPDATPDAIGEIADAIAAADAPDSAFAAEAMDVGLYTAFALVRRLVLLRVVATIMKTIATGREDRKYSLLAHSLGTTVAHDAVHEMATTSWLTNAEAALDGLNEHGVGETVAFEDIERARKRYGAKPFAPGLFKFEAIFMISNTSALLQKTARNAFESVVRPAFSGDGARTHACLRYYNIDHRFDPISKVRRFRAAEAWPRAAAMRTAVDVFDVEHVHDVNVSALEHYLIHPLVHREILGSVCPARFGRADYAHAGRRVEPGGDFPRWGDNYVDEDLQDAILEGLEALQLRGRDGLARVLAAMPGLVADVRRRLAA